MDFGDSFLSGLQDVAEHTASSIAQDAGSWIGSHTQAALGIGPAPTGNLTAAQIAAGKTGQAPGGVIGSASAALHSIPSWVPLVGGALIAGYLIFGRR